MTWPRMVPAVDWASAGADSSMQPASAQLSTLRSNLRDAERDLRFMVWPLPGRS